MPINTDLLLEIREQITSHPETHDQNQWGRRTACGTTHCIAGWAIVLSGATFDWTSVYNTAGTSVTVNDGAYRIEEYAACEMGLSEDEADDLFFEYDNAEALAMLDELIEKGKNAS